jgi:hypothetical protein
MKPTSSLHGLLASAMAALLIGGTASANAPGGLGRVFSAGLDKLGIVFKGIGSLAGGAGQGAVWRVDIRSGERRRIGNTTDLAWPVPSPDGRSVFVLRGRQVVRLVVDDGRETPVGSPADWRKLLGVLPDGTVLGFVEDDPRPRPALLQPDGSRADLPPPADDAERKRNGALLQEGHDYADGSRLEVRDSARGGRGRDVFLVDGAGARNLTDCGDDLCGQPARAQDGLAVFYMRATPP